MATEPVEKLAPSGLYAIASFDGAPIDPSDCDALGLLGANDAIRSPGAILRAVDNDGTCAASYVEQGANALAFVGSLDRVMQTNDKSPAETALHCMSRWGSDVAAHLPGEWSFMNWDADSRSATIGVSRAIRDPIYFASDGKRVAIAPQIDALARLPWVGREIDDVGFACTSGRAALRRKMAHSTLLPKVRILEPGSLYRLDSDGAVHSIAASTTIEPWHGSFADAVTVLEGELRAIVRDAMAPHRTIAITLSGGLDSALIAWIASEELRSDQNLFCITSVSPAGSKLKDERRESHSIAEMLGLPVEFVIPDEDADPYMPNMATMLHGGSALVSPRHYLDAALLVAARNRGADAVLSGHGGESNVTRSENILGLQSGLRYARNIARQKFFSGQPSARERFHVKLSPALYQRLPAEIVALNCEQPISRPRLPSAAIGLTLRNPNLPYTFTSVPGAGIRHYRPFRAPSFRGLMAGMPAGFTVRGGLSRALGRAMLTGHVPEAVRMATSGRPFSPDYEVRLQRKAAHAADRVDRYGDGLAAALIDLPWLRQALKGMAAAGPKSVRSSFTTQLTACSAEFLNQWERSG